MCFFWMLKTAKTPILAAELQDYKLTRPAMEPPDKHGLLGAFVWPCLSVDHTQIGEVDTYNERTWPYRAELWVWPTVSTSCQVNSSISFCNTALFSRVRPRSWHDPSFLKSCNYSTSTS
uniref:Uncharacterized protein n=1 Tax=Anguilla anguilla TaxID=7936 RepID=A0A0E9X873_ANGAN